MGYENPEYLAWLQKYISKNHLKPGQKLQLSVSIDPTFGPGVTYQVGAFSADDRIEPKLDALVSRHSDHVQEQLETKLSTFKSLDFQLPKSDDELKSDALHNLSNNGFDWRKLQDASDSEGNIDWKKVPDLRK